MRREVAIDVDEPRDHSGDQFLTLLRIHRLVVRTHLGIGVMFIGKGQDRNERPAVFLAPDKFLPIVMTQRHATHEAGRPVVRMGDALLVL